MLSNKMIVIIIILIVILIIANYNIIKPEITLVEALKFRDLDNLELQTCHQIPKIIYQTNESDVVPEKMGENIDKLLIMNKDYSYIYFNANERRKFIANNFDEDVIQSYDKLIPGAYKADLFRYCLLYVKGGVYLDSGMVSILPLRYIIRYNITFISAVDQCKDDYCDGQTGLLNGFIGCIPRHPIIGIAIKKVVSNIKNENYGTCPIDITGPLVLGKSYKEYTGQQIKYRTDSEIRLLSFDFPRGSLSGTIKYEDKIILRTKYPEYREEMTEYIKRFGKNGNLHDYHNLWRTKKVFK